MTPDLFPYSVMLGAFFAPLLLVLAGVVVLGVDLAILRGQPAHLRRLMASVWGGAGCLIALFHLVSHAPAGQLPGGTVVMDAFARGSQGLLIGLSVIALALSAGSKLEKHIGEFFALVLWVTAAFVVLVSSNSLILIFAALEAGSLGLYVLTGFKVQQRAAVNAAYRYFLIGGVSAAFTLYGISLLYGAAGSFDLAVLGSKLKVTGGSSLVWMGLIFLLVGFGFKIASVPFHLWVPEVYSGAPASVAGYVGSVSKGASILILAKVLWIAFPARDHQSLPWLPGVVGLALLSLILGTCVALAQGQIKKLLGYSAIANTGFLLLGVLAGGAAGLWSIQFYITTYGIALMGTFAVLERIGGDGSGSLLGLGRRSPLLALSLSAFLLSIAGLPPFAGFLGKMFLFFSLYQSGLSVAPWILGVGLATSCVAFYYYLRVLKTVFISRSDSEIAKIALRWGDGIIALLAVSLLALGIFPDLLVKSFSSAAGQWWLGK